MTKDTFSMRLAVLGLSMKELHRECLKRGRNIKYARVYRFIHGECSSLEAEQTLKELEEEHGKLC